MVIAEPLASGVEGNDEQALPLQQAHELPAGGSRGHGVPWGTDRVEELRTEPVEDRGLEHAVPDLGRLSPQDLPQQVLLGVRKASAQLSQEGIRVLDVAQGQDQEAQTHGPPLDLVLQVVERVLADRDLHRHGQELDRLRRGEPQVLQPHLRQAARRPQRAQRQRRVAPGGDDQPQGRRRMLEQPAQQLVDLRFARDPVVVVQDQDDGGVEVVQLVGQGAGQHGNRRQVRRPQHPGRLLARPGDRRLDRGQDVAQEHPEVTVGFVQRNPGARLRPRLGPVADQRTLAVARRRRDQGHRRLQPDVELLVQPAPADEIPGHRGPVQLGPQDRVLVCWVGRRQAGTPFQGAVYPLHGCILMTARAPSMGPGRLPGRLAPQIPLFLGDARDLGPPENDPASLQPPGGRAPKGAPPDTERGRP